MLCYDLEGEMGVGVEGRLKREGIYTHILIADSCCYAAEANIVKQLSSN